MPSEASRILNPTPCRCSVRAQQIPASPPYDQYVRFTHSARFLPSAGTRVVVAAAVSHTIPPRTRGWGRMRSSRADVEKRGRTIPPAPRCRGCRAVEWGRRAGAGAIPKLFNAVPAASNQDVEKEHHVGQKRVPGGAAALATYGAAAAERSLRLRVFDASGAPAAAELVKSLLLIDAAGRPFELLPRAGAGGLIEIGVPDGKFEIVMTLPVREFGQVYLFADNGGRSTRRPRPRASCC